MNIFNSYPPNYLGIATDYHLTNGIPSSLCFDHKNMKLIFLIFSKTSFGIKASDNL